MSQHSKCKNPICAYLGPKPLVPKGPKLRERFQNIEPEDSAGPSSAKKSKIEPKLKTSEDLKNLYRLGQDCSSNNVLEIADILLKRDIPEVYELTENSTELDEMICIPIEFIPRVPKIIVSNEEFCDNALTSEMDALAESVRTDLHLTPEARKDYSEHSFSMGVGDFVEKNAFNAAKEVFANKTLNVVMIQGIEIPRINPDRKAEARELDLLIIIEKLGLIINIECQKKFTKVDKLAKKLEDHKNFFEDWFGAELNGNWKFVSMFYHEQKDFLKHCDHCWKYMACGKDELKRKLENLCYEKQIIENQIEEFKTLVKYLLFCTSKFPLPIGLNFSQKLEDAMVKQGSTENIRIWGFPTPEQKALLYENYLLFMAAWGTGKTTLMTWKAIELASRGEKVLFLIFTHAYFVKKETLLFLDLQKKFEELENVTIKQISFDDVKSHGADGPNVIQMRPRNNALQNLTKDFNYIFVDEFFEDFEHFSEESRNDFSEALRKKKTVWIALSNQYNPKPSQDVTEIPDFFCQTLNIPFKVGSIKTPLRSPQKVYNELKKQVNPESGNQIRLNDFLLNSSKLPPTLTDGRFSVTNVNPEWSLSEILRECFKEFPENKAGIIVIDAFMNDFPAKNTCSCRNIAAKTLIDKAFENNRRLSPLYHLDEYSSDMEEIKQNKDQRFLVTTVQLIRGYEANLIINLAGFESWSRSSAMLITVLPTPNWYYLALPILESISIGNHGPDSNLELNLDSSLTFIGINYND